MSLQSDFNKLEKIVGNNFKNRLQQKKLAEAFQKLVSPHYDIQESLNEIEKLQNR